MTVPAFIIANEPSERERQEPHVSDHEKNEEVAAFPPVPGECAEPDESLFAREVEVPEHHDREKPRSFPGKGLVM